MTCSSFPSPPAPREIQTDVLLIDDSVSDLRLLIELMALRHLRVSVATDGERGYRQAVQLQPGLILLDVRMPGIDGFSVCRQLKANPLTRAIPVIFLTVANNLAERLEGFAAGGVDYIGKPFEAQEVLARVGVHLQRASVFPDPAGDSGAGVPKGDGPVFEATLVVSAQRILRKAIASPPGLDELAGVLTTNRRRLNDAFQALCGQPVFGWFREERLRQAYLMVSQTNTPFNMVGESLGYSSPANFTRAFHRRYGFAPSEVRAQLLNGNLIDPVADAD